MDKCLLAIAARAACALGLLLSGGAAAASDCQLACKPGAANCNPQCGGAPCQLKSPEGQPVILSSARFQTVHDCKQIKDTNGNLEMRYRHKGRWFAPPEGIKPGALLIAVFDKYPPDPCGVPSRNCLQTRMNGMVAAVGGHGIDNKDSKPGGQGDPCLMGLPCGAIVPPPAQWSFQLPDAARAGTLTVRLARGTPPAGQPAEQSLRVERGTVSGNGSWFTPGAQYAYRYADEAGRAVASGEFSLISRSTHDTLRTLAQRRVAEGMSESLAWSDTLAANQLEWDALQLSLNPGGAQ